VAAGAAASRAEKEEKWKSEGLVEDKRSEMARKAEEARKREEAERKKREEERTVRMAARASEGDGDTPEERKRRRDERQAQREVELKKEEEERRRKLEEKKRQMELMKKTKRRKVSECVWVKDVKQQQLHVRLYFHFDLIHSVTIFGGCFSNFSSSLNNESTAVSSCGACASPIDSCHFAHC